MAGKAESLPEPTRNNMPFVVTSLSKRRWGTQESYEDLCCVRGRWRTGSRSSSWICSRTARRRPRCGPTSWVCADGGGAEPGGGRDRDGAGAVRNDPDAAAEYGGAGGGECAEDSGVDVLPVSATGPVRAPQVPAESCGDRSDRRRALRGHPSWKAGSVRRRWNGPASVDPPCEPSILASFGILRSDNHESHVIRRRSGAG